MQVLQKNKVNTAIQLGQQLFSGIERKNGEPYINHCIGVMKILENYGFRGNILIAGFLHDCYEDTQCNSQKIKEEFGNEIDFYIQAVSKFKRKGIAREKDYSPRFTAYFLHLKEFCIAEPKIVFIKLADIIDNLKTIDIFREEKITRKKREIQECYLPFFNSIQEHMTPWQEKKYIKMKEEIHQILKTKI